MLAPLVALTDTQDVNLELRRVIVFARDLSRLAAFYRNVLGLPELTVPDDSRTWREFAAGACTVALHNGGREIDTGRAPKLVFYVSDVAAARTELNDRGCNFGRVMHAGEVAFCSGSDPEGTVLSLSSRV